MTDKEIIKALDCMKGISKNDISTITIKNAIALINRQQAEIERLQSILIRFLNEMSEWGNKNNVDTTNFSIIPIAESEKESIVKQLKADAIKEFAERLKKMSIISGDIPGWRDVTTNEMDIDNLVKEMVGEGK